MMKCKCGNEQGKPQVNPQIVSFKDTRSREEVQIFFMAGFIGDQCYFCAVPLCVGASQSNLPAVH